MDLAQFECSVATLGPLLMASAVNGTVPPRLGNRSTSAAPQGCYRCAGEDEWCTISVQSDEEWQALVDTVSQMSMGRMSIPGVVEGWSVRDLLGHVMTWEYELLHAIDAHGRGEPTPSYDDLDAWNEMAVATLRPTPLAVILIQMGETHGRLVSTIEALPEEAIRNSGLARWIADDAWEHYREHREDIERWQAEHSQG